MKIKIELPEDTLSLCGDKISALSEGVSYSFSLSEIEAAMLITTDMGPFYDDMCLSLRIDSETAIFIMSMHRDFNPFLFEQLAKAIPLDFRKIAEATACTENKLFMIYQRA